MNTRIQPIAGLPALPLHPNIRSKGRAVVTAALSAAAFAMPAQAIDFGPDGMFSLTGFAEVTVGRAGNRCINCQYVPDTEGKEKQWADAIRSGVPFQTVNTTNWQAQPYLGARYNLGKGFKLEGLLSQRWRDGTVDGQKLETRWGGLVDVPGFWYEKNVALSHEDYGMVRVGSMTTRAWNVADYPYGTNIGLASAWGSSGAGYGMLANAVRYTSRMLDVAEGDLVLEATYDRGNTGFTKNKPEFWELYAQYHKGDLVLDAMYQNAVNGTPSNWGHGPFSGLTPEPADDAKLTGSSQGIVMLMGRYQYNNQLELSGGVRFNRWSGADAKETGVVATPIGPQSTWNNMFNVNWNATLPASVGGGSPGYGANSIDTMLGARYRIDNWTVSTGLVHFSQATTYNPMERGQSNTATINTLGLQYDYGNGLKANATWGMVRYARLGLAPMSMPGNAAFTEVDSRVTKDGNWIVLGLVYGF
jgi:predicted porin